MQIKPRGWQSPNSYIAGEHWTLNLRAAFQPITFNLVAATCTYEIHGGDLNTASIHQCVVTSVFPGSRDCRSHDPKALSRDLILFPARVPRKASYVTFRAYTLSVSRYQLPPSVVDYALLPGHPLVGWLRTARIMNRCRRWFFHYLRMKHGWHGPCYTMPDTSDILISNRFPSKLSPCLLFTLLAVTDVPSAPRYPRSPDGEIPHPGWPSTLRSFPITPTLIQSSRQKIMLHLARIRPGI